MKESDFLARIKERKSSASKHPVQRLSHPGRYGQPVRTLPSDLVEEFAWQLTAAGGHVHRVTDGVTARVQMRDILGGRSFQAAFLTEHTILEELDMPLLLQRMGIDVLVADNREAAVATIAQVDLGLTGAEYAVASSGTLVMAASPEHPRVASLLPPVHIAFIQEAQLLPDLAALAARLRQDYGESPPSGVALITGPSRTGDIEQILSIGVHGPGEIHVFVVA